MRLLNKEVWSRLMEGQSENSFRNLVTRVASIKGGLYSIIYSKAIKLVAVVCPTDLE